MKKIWLVALSTYRRRVRSGMFLILTLGLPVLMVIAGALPWLMHRGTELAPVGYVDHTGRLATVTQVTVDDLSLSLIPFDDEDAARAAFLRDDIEGYLVIPVGYYEGEPTTYYGARQPDESAHTVLNAFMRRAILADQPEWVLERLHDVSQITYVAQDTGEELVSGPGLIFRIALPAVLAILFGLLLLTGVSQMGTAIVREKEQRAMEMVITSLNARELVAGKVLGLSLLSLTQMTVWGIAGGGAAMLALSGSMDLATLHVPWGAIIWAIALGVPTYLLYAVLAAGLGILAGDSQQAQQLAGVLGLVGMAPFWLVAPLIGAPSGTAAVVLTVFPMTGAMVGLLRMAMVEVPAWQLIASLGLILVCLGVSIYGVARVFRAAMLMYGKNIRPREILQALRQA
jgi:ABC-2 type transport system permease protein